MSSSATVSNDYLTFQLADQSFGLSVLQVNDVLGPQKMTRAPLAPSAVAGVMNLRGRIVTAINVRRCLGLPPLTESQGMSIVIEHGTELFNLMIDQVGDVLALDPARLEKVPITIDPAWRSVASHIYKTDAGLLVILDIAQLLEAAGSSTMRMAG